MSDNLAMFGRADGLAAPDAASRRMGALMFCAGLYAMLAQILLLRELLVAFYGNELTLGAALTAWLALIGAGSLAVRPLLRRPASVGLWRLLTGLLAAQAAVLPAQVWLIRVMRIVLGTPFGEYTPFAAMLAGTVLALLPTGLSVGMIFPCACHLLKTGEGGARIVGRLYALESLGSLVAGILFTFAFAQWLTPFASMALAGLAAAGGAALAAPSRAVRRLLLVPLAILVLAAGCPGLLAGLETKSLEARWRAFGALPEGASAAGRLIASVDSRYQNLALIEAHGQTTLYGNGQVLGVFPDPIAGEHKIHFIMAQNPAAAAVLLIGGNPATDIPELLKYPLRRLVHLELDGEIGRLLDAAGGREYRRAVRDPRFFRAAADGPRFVKTSRETFDAIIVDAPAPSTVALNRFYTLDFYRAVRRRLADGGFMYTSVEASEDLRDEAAALTASVRQTLQRVFPRVLIAAGVRNQYFAGMDNSALTFDRQALFERSAGAGLRHRYFRPEYFFNADEISPEKTEFVERRLAGMPAPVNTALRPMTAYYQLRLWSHFSGSRLEGILDGLSRVRFHWAAAGIGLAGLVLLVVGLAAGARRRVAGGTWGRRWARGMLGLVLASTGFCGMALELILIYVFQSLLGYVYARIGLIVAVFMLGLMLGALAAGRRPGSEAGSWRALLGLDVLLLLLAGIVPVLADACLYSPALAGSGAWIEGVIDGAMLLAGWALGAQFVVVVRLLGATGVGRGAAAARANAADLFGAALGGFAVGVVALPLWGVETACLLLVVLKGAGLLAAASARLAVGRKSAVPSPSD